MSGLEMSELDVIELALMSFRLEDERLDSLDSAREIVASLTGAGFSIVKRSSPLCWAHKSEVECLKDLGMSWGSLTVWTDKDKAEAAHVGVEVVPLYLIPEAE